MCFGVVFPDSRRMPVRSDFRVIPVNQCIGGVPPDYDTSFPYVGPQSAVKTFQIDGVPVGDAYLLIAYTKLRQPSVVIKINDRDLPWIDIFPSDHGTHLKNIEPGYLVRGINTVQIISEGLSVAFIAFYTVVHWREQEPPKPRPPVHP